MPSGRSFYHEKQQHNSKDSGICGGVSGAGTDASVFDGTDTADRLNAFPHAHTRAPLRLRMRLALGTGGRRGGSTPALRTVRYAADVPDRALHGV